MYLKLSLVSLLAICISTSAQQCANKETCNECIKQFECAWCSEASENATQHCFEKEKIHDRCPTDLILDPASQAAIIEKRPIVTGIGNGEITQISPQYVKLKLRKDEEYTLDFQYGQAHDFPVDLYYIMDLSASLATDKARLAQNGKQLVETMQSVTSDFKIGFGSFVDKTDAPFISTKPSKILHPCSGCDPAYSYKNHMSLNSNGDEFSRRVDAAKVSGNLDIPEGGFDALMQAMVCGREIGWRNNSRRIIVFSTDAPFHVAGDGKLAGVIIPNDGNCHTVNGNYTESLKFDYPSISHINHVAKLNNFHILFVVKEKVKTLYKKLEKSIENSRTVDLDVNNQITNEIRKFYEEISTMVKMTTNTSNALHVDFAADCDGSGEYIKNKECTNVVADQIVNYRATIKATRCGRQEPIRIKPSTQDVVLQVDLEVMCECDCGADTPNSPECNNHGDLHCGVCECHMGFNGKHCECNQQMGEDHLKDSECKMGNDTENCSSRGTCLCNVCQCDRKQNSAQQITGKYCECDNYSCPKSNGLCSNNGECVCGKCKCNHDWSGYACECKNDNTTCINSPSAGDGAVCNSHGTCECGKCKCDKSYFGQYCEECSNCFGGKCRELKPCIECKVHSIGAYKDDCDFQCAQYTINVVPSIDETQVETVVCRFIDDDDCKLIFTYRYENDKIVADALGELQCSKPVNVLALVLGIIGGILLVGILALIAWKVWTSYRDRREYSRFMEEKSKVDFQRGENPLFRSAVTKTINPTYGRSSFLKRRTPSFRN